MDKKTVMEEKRGLPNTVKYNDGKDEEQLQVMCACNDNYSKQQRKKNTMPVNAKVIAALKKENISYCDECECMPWVVMPRKLGERLTKNWEAS